MHFPFPLTVLSIDFTNMAVAAWNRLSGQGPQDQIGWQFANGYFYFLWKPHGDDSKSDQPDWKKSAARDAARLAEHWSHDVRPRIESLCRSMTTPDFDSMPRDELARQLREHFDSCATGFGLTQFAMNALFAAVDPFVEFCKARWGADALSMVGTMLDGVDNETRASEVALFRIARHAARQSPEAKQALIDRYLDRYGWRPEIWFDLSKPTWREDPDPVLELLRRYAVDDRANPILAGRRAAARRRRLVRKVELELSTAASQLAEFRRLYRIALPYVAVREGRALWQLTCTGVLRRPVISLGTKLADAGALRAVEDILHLSLDEIDAIGRGDAQNLRDMVGERRRAYERWRSVVPPAFIGTLDPAAKGQLAYFSGIAADEGQTDAERRVLKGSAASRGVASGKVRIVTGLAHGETFQQGEVLVCRTTSPAWTPLVARARAVVTESGGMLAHTAIVAREFAIPCVLAVGGATRRLRDGMQVTVDGGQGIVRIE